MSKALLMSWLLGWSCGALFSQEIRNGDFSKGASDWMGDGRLIYLDASNKVLSQPEAGATPVLQVQLKSSQWAVVKQNLHPSSKESAVRASIEIMASPDFQPLEKSRAYSPVDFKEGGSYTWSAEVFPKCDLLVTVKDSTYYYRLFSLQPTGSWKTFQIDFQNLTTRSRGFSLAFPPGTGTLWIKSIK